MNFHQRYECVLFAPSINSGRALSCVGQRVFAHIHPTQARLRDVMRKIRSDHFA